MVNRQLLADMGYDMPRTQEEFMGLCRRIQERREETGVRAYAFGMLYNDAAAVVAMPFLLDAYTDSEYVQWLNLYRIIRQGFPLKIRHLPVSLRELMSWKAWGCMRTATS